MSTIATRVSGQARPVGPGRRGDGRTRGRLAEREAANRAFATIRHLMKSVDLPVCLEKAGITDRSRNSRWAVEAHKEQDYLSRSARILSVKDIERIYDKAFSDWGAGR